MLAIVSTVGDLPSSALTRLKKLVRYKEHGIYTEDEPDIADIEAELLSVAEEGSGIPGELE